MKKVMIVVAVMFLLGINSAVAGMREELAQAKKVSTLAERITAIDALMPRLDDNLKAQALVYKGWTLQGMGKTAEAKVCFEEVIALNSCKWYVAKALVSLAEIVPDKTEKLGYLQKVLDNPTHSYQATIEALKQMPTLIEKDEYKELLANVLYKTPATEKNADLLSFIKSEQEKLKKI